MLLCFQNFKQGRFCELQISAWVRFAPYPTSRCGIGKFFSIVTVNGQVLQVRAARFHGDGPDGRVLCSQPMVVPEAS